MGTRSDIIVHLADGRYKRVYCHWDGYLSHNGALLAAHYASQEFAEKLVGPGDMSSLGKFCNKPKGHSHAKPKKGYSVYYGRDRGETGVAGKTFDTLAAAWPAEDTWTEFTYVWSREYGAPEGLWYVASADEGTQALQRLDEALAGVITVKAPIKAFGAVIGRHK